MPNPPFDMGVQNNFPQAAVIQAAQENANRQLQAQTLGNQSLIQGLQSIGQVGQSLLDRRRAMAQAMAGAQYIAAKNPELFQPTQTTSQMPVAQNQTAAYNPQTGTVTPNTGTAGAVTTRPQTTTIPPAMDIPTMATALFGTPFNDLLKTGFEQHKLDIETGLKKSEMAQQAQIAARTSAIQQQQATTQAVHTGAEDIDTLLQRRVELTKSLPSNIFGWESDQAKEAVKQMADIDQQLASKGYKGPILNRTGTANPSSQSLKTPKFGATYTVNTSGQP